MTTKQDFMQNEKWLKRAELAYDMLDKKRDGFITRQSYLSMIDDLSKIASDRPEFIAKAKKALEEALDAMGLDEGMKVNKTKFLELAIAFNIGESGRLSRGELTFMEKSAYATFDVLDKNGNGWITFADYKALMDLSQMPEDAAQAAFDALDTDKTGKLDKKKYAAADVKFWCTLSGENDGMFGAAFN